eukprot:TRINITY_DN15278_c0_g1_i1.p1 TRINITY_DN15278_c0_g1~~TRINITY_DN15278_c0_g1_i1.p1  ORF type:complete len:646 (+),score=147.76 TRINITY_DN15278_c0_g1_i1:139-2076(+)
MAEVNESGGARAAAHSLLHALSSDHDQSQGSLFEYFAVVGLPPTEMVHEAVGTPQTPQLLYAFPEEKYEKIDQNIKHFCFPNGVETRWIQTSRRMSSTDLHSVIFGSLTQLESSENSFIFLVTTDVLLFGVCVYVNEILGDPSALVREKLQMTGDPFTDGSMKEKLDMDSPKRRPVAAASAVPPAARREAFHASLRRPVKTTTDVVTKRCYVFVTKYPFFSLHFEVLYGLLARDRLYRLQRTQGMLSGGPAPILGSEGEVAQILASYYAQPVPKAGEAASFNLSSELRNIKFVCPPLDDITSLADWALAASFKMLSLDIILTMFACALLEGRIAIVCQDLGILSAVSLSLIPMLQPIVWQGILIPVLPSIMMDCLDAPVPIVLGISEIPPEREGTLGDLLVVDVDKNEMTLPNIHYEELPNKKELLALLEPFHKKLFRRAAPAGSNTPSKLLSARATYGMNPCKTTDSEIETVRCIQKVFTGYLDKFLDTFKHAIVKQNFDLHTANFDTKIHDLVPLLAKNYRNFAKLFFETQQFNFFQEKFIHSIKKKKQDDHELFDRVQRLIKMESEEKQALELQLKGLGSSGERERAQTELRACNGRLMELKRQQDDLVAAYPEFSSRATPIGDLEDKSQSFLGKLFGSSKK